VRSRGPQQNNKVFYGFQKCRKVQALFTVELEKFILYVQAFIECYSGIIDFIPSKKYRMLVDFKLVYKTKNYEFLSWLKEIISIF